MFEKVFFTVSAALTLGSAIMVVASRNIVHSCVYLLGTLLGVAGLYVTLGADLIAVTQIMVYVGGVVILILFAVMLTGGKEFMDLVKGSFDRKNFMGDIKTFIYAIFCAGVLGGVVTKVFFQDMVTKIETGEMVYSSTVESIGTALITDHVLAFEISSVLLLGALVGASMIARPRD